MANKNIIAQIEKSKSDIENTQEKIKQLKNKEKKLLSEQRQAERSARTHKLIERGAMLESINPSIVHLSNEQLKNYLLRVLKSDNAKILLQEIARAEQTGKSIV